MTLLFSQQTFCLVKAEKVLVEVPSVPDMNHSFNCPNRNAAIIKVIKYAFTCLFLGITFQNVTAMKNYWLGRLLPIKLTCKTTQITTN